MKVMNTLRQLVFTHKAWPYPRGRKEQRQAIVVSLVIVLVALACIAAGLKYNEQKSLSQQDIRLSAQDMTSYTSQAVLLAEKSRRQTFIQPYRVVYVQQLSDDLININTTLRQHDVSTRASRHAHQLIDINEQTTSILAAILRHPDDNTFTQYLPQLRALARQSLQVEESL